jgi:hypothetical protein
LSKDPLEELFESIDPLRGIDDATLHAPGTSIDRLHRELSRRQLRHSFGRRGAVFSIVSFVVLASSAAAITLLRSPVRDVASIGCYQKSSLTSTAEVVPYGNNPLAICNGVWHWKKVPRAGSPFGSLCVLGDGSLAAFPPSRERDVCARLGLPIFNGLRKNIDVSTFQTAAISYFALHPCVSPANASFEVRILLGRYGLPDWQVRNTGSQSPSSCAFPAFQISARIVDIVGNPIR